MRSQFFGLLVLVWFSSAIGLIAQNTGTVFSPDVGAGVEAVEARVTFDPDSDSFAKRLHYQYRFNDSFRLRGVVAYRSDDGSKWDYRYFRLEGLY